MTSRRPVALAALAGLVTANDALTSPRAMTAPLTILYICRSLPMASGHAIAGYDSYWVKCALDGNGGKPLTLGAHNKNTRDKVFDPLAMATSSSHGIALPMAYAMEKR